MKSKSKDNFSIKNLILSNTNSNGIFENILNHFDMVCMIDYDGTQGQVGLLEHKDTKTKVVFKIPLEPGFILRHEYKITNTLMGSRNFIPYFCETYGFIKTKISYNESQPFKVEEGDPYTICGVLLTEYIKDSLTMTKYISQNRISHNYSLLCQALLAIEIGRRKYGLIHYDLHTDNLLISKCDKNSLFLYNFGDKKYLIKTYGVYPVLIDFGFSYIKDQNDYLYGDMSHTDSGYLGCLFDPYYDARILLMNASSDMSKFKVNKQFRERILAIYNNLEVDKERGWDIRKGQYSASEMITYTIEEIEDNQESIFLTKTYNCVDIIQSLIKLPLRNLKNGNFRPHYKSFIKEFSKFESCVKSTFTKLDILIQLIESARKIVSRDNITNEVAETFRHDFSVHINDTVSFYTPPQNVNYRGMLKSLFKMVDCIETVYYRVMSKISEEKRKTYKYQYSNCEIFDMIDLNYNTDYTLDENSIIYVWDLTSEVSFKRDKLTDEVCEKVNSTDRRKRAEVLWEIL